MERVLFIPSGDLRLEARYAPGAGARAALLCHPHPRYGGTMENAVVVAAQRALAEAGLATLRFNTRGVGASTGAVAGDATEVADVLACLDWLRESAAPPAESLWIVGYSFGAWAGRLAAIRDGGVEGLVLVAPPAAMFSFEGEDFPGPVLAVVGDKDEYAPVDAVRAALPEATLEVLPKVDHFFWGFEKRVGELAAAFILKGKA